MFSGLRDSLNPTIAVVATLLTALAVLLLLVIEWLRRRNEGLRRRAAPDAA
jgi:putative spermidine/putrescine transport system permease protein